MRKIVITLLFSCWFCVAYAQTEAVPAPSPSQEHAITPLPSVETTTDSYQDAFTKMLFSLAGLVLLVILTFWILKKISKGKFRFGSHHTIEILEKRSLSPKTVLYLVEVQGKQVLLSESQLEVRPLQTLDINPSND